MHARVITISEWKQFIKAVSCFHSRKTYMCAYTHTYIYIHIFPHKWVFVHRHFPCMKVCSTYSPIQENVWLLSFIAQNAWVYLESQSPWHLSENSTLLQVLGTWSQTQRINSSLPIFSKMIWRHVYVYRCPDESFLPSHHITVRKKPELQYLAKLS